MISATVLARLWYPVSVLYLATKRPDLGLKYPQAKDGGLVIWLTYPSPRRKKGKHGEGFMMVDRLEKQVMNDKGPLENEGFA